MNKEDFDTKPHNHQMMETKQRDQDKVPEIHSENNVENMKVTETDSGNNAQDDKTKPEAEISAQDSTTNNNKPIKPTTTDSGKDVKGPERNSGHGAQVVMVTEAHSYELDQHALEQILMREEVKDLPVVVVSVAGAYRSGKSFLLNFFLRYLTSSESARQDGTWLGEDSAPLVGFKWRSGSVRTTLGILMWSEPFILTRPSGEKVAVLLVDTQGTFDSTSTVNDCSTIFALSTLLSSVQIYNLSQNIQEDDLQFLQLFTDYGRMVKDQGSKAFQVLEFLVRDWQFPWEHPYGPVGGEQLLQEKLEINPNLTKEMFELRKHIRTSFEKVSCFLMPHPGFQVLKPDFKGNISDIGTKFKEYVKVLVTSLFSSENLSPKTVNGKTVKARDLFELFKTYMTVFKSGEIPTLSSVTMAMEKANLLSTMNEATAVYLKKMDSQFGPDQPSMPAVDVYALHIKYSDLAKETFTSKIKMGSEEDAEMYLDRLMMKLEKLLSQFMQSNKVKTHDLITRANEAYEDAVRKFSNNQPLCVHPLDLEKVHKAGRDAAVDTFDANRKRITKRKDVERPPFIESLEKRSKFLEQPNQQHNASAVLELHLQYKQCMMTQLSSSTLLAEEEFTSKHSDAKLQAVKDFRSKRNIPNEYPEDDYMDKLNKAIDDSFREFAKLNNKKNKSAIDAAVDEFDTSMQMELWRYGKLCWDPCHLEMELKDAADKTLRKFYPNESEGYYTDIIYDPKTTPAREHKLVVELMKIIKKHQDGIIRSNDYTNTAIANRGFELYMETMANTYSWWSQTSAWTYHERAKKKATELFYSKRTDGRREWEMNDNKYQDMMDRWISGHFEANYA